MNEKTRIQIEEMKKQTIGVEVEMNNIDRSRAAKVAAEFFGTGRYENTAHRNGYSTWSAWDSQGREWKFQKDVSISGPDSEKCETGHPDPDLRRHGNPAGADSPTPQRREPKATPPGAAESTSTLEPRATPRRPCAIWPTSWQATRACWPKPSISTTTA